MEQPNNRQLSTESAPEKLPIRYYFDRCPQEVTLNILQYADIPTLNSFSQTNCNDATLAKDISLWLRHIQATLAPFIPQWAETFPVENDLFDAKASLTARWQEIKQLEEIFRKTKPDGGYSRSDAYRSFREEIQKKVNLAKNIFVALFSSIKESNVSLKEMLPWVKLLVEKNFPEIFDINLIQRISTQDFLLYAAVEANQIDEVKILLSMGADPFCCYQQESDDGASPFDFAIKNGKKDIIKAFIDHTCNMEFVSKELRIAVGQKNIEVIKLLIAAGADVNYKDESGTITGLDSAKKIQVYGDGGNNFLIEKESVLAVLTYLFNVGLKADLNFSGLAILLAHEEAVKLFLEWGAEVNFPDPNKNILPLIVLDRAFSFWYGELISGYPVAKKCREDEEAYLRIAKLLIRAGADFNVKGDNPRYTIFENLNVRYATVMGKTFTNGESTFCIEVNPIKELIDYANTIGKKVQKIIKDSKIKEIFNDNNSDSELTVQQKLMAVLQYYNHPGKLAVGSLSFSVSRFSFHTRSHITEVQALLKDLAGFGEQASAQQCHDALQATLETCQKKPGYDCDGTLALLGELLLAQLKREIGKEALAAREAVRKQKQPVTAVAEEMGEQFITPTMGKK